MKWREIKSEKEKERKEGESPSGPKCHIFPERMFAGCYKNEFKLGAHIFEYICLVLLPVCNNSLFVWRY